MGDVTSLDEHRKKGETAIKEPKDIFEFAAQGGPVVSGSSQNPKGPVLLKPGEKMTSQGFVVGAHDPDGIGLMGLDID